MSGTCTDPCQAPPQLIAAEGQPLFVPDGDLYVPTQWARGPWNKRFLHGGPPAALLAHALLARREDPALAIARMTIDLYRPVPYGPLAVDTVEVRSGRRIRLVDAFLRAGDTVVARAGALMLRRTPGAGGATILAGPAPQTHIAHIPPLALRGPDEADDAVFHQSVDCRSTTAPKSDSPVQAWFRLPFELLPGRALHGIERVAAISDFTSAVGGLCIGAPARFINADISLALQREPVGEWICLAALARGDADGIATSTVGVFDLQGLIGSATCCCLRND